MATIELKTKNSSRTKRVVGYEPGTTKKSREGGDVIEDPGGQISWQCKDANATYLVWFYDFTTGDPVWPFTTGPDPVQGPLPVPGVTQYLRVNSTTPRVMKLNYTGAVKYWALDANDVTGARWLDPMIVIRPMNLLASKAVNVVLLGVVCAVVGAAFGAAVVYAMMP
jgi:hypothetical protein